MDWSYQLTKVRDLDISCKCAIFHLLIPLLIPKHRAKGLVSILEICAGLIVCTSLLHTPMVIKIHLVAVSENSRALDEPENIY